MTSRFQKLDTKLVHAGEDHASVRGAVAMPIFQSAMYETAYDDGEPRYIRYNNTPNHEVLHRKLASLENAEAALVTSSGMAAISTAFLSFLSTGDHALVQDCLYGGTHGLVARSFAGFGITFDFIDGADPDSWKAKVTPRTKVIYVETVSNPLMGVPELEAVVAFAREHSLVSMIDNTFASPANFRPAEWGFDISLHSGTKYLNGHSDVVAGAVIGKAEQVDAVGGKMRHLGGSLDPHACYLLHRGMKTLAVRVARQNESALAIARFLEAHAAVARVSYPGLESSPDHARATRFFDGYGGMLSFVPAGGVKAAERLFERVTIPLVAPSLGSVESLLTRPAQTSHAGVAREDRERIGIVDELVRMSVGIEDPDELIDDLRRALD
jgi:cystathionine beta-lyase/cystathionine gamma-synthase